MNRPKAYSNGYSKSCRSNRHIDSAVLPGKVRQPIQAYVPHRQNGQGNGRSAIDSALAMPERKKQRCTSR
ncbi:MAG: hypothetical protein AAF614_24900 [Chloroflexota bacterium]